MFKKLKKEYLVFLALAVLIAVFYGNTLKNGFSHDDIGQIVQNKYVQSLEYLPKVITGCTWEFVFGGCDGSNYYRPLHSLSYLLTWQISSQPWFFHLVNLFYFWFSASLVFVLIKKLTKSFILAFFTSYFFIIHPINNEVVNWVATVPELLLAVFGLLSLIFFLQYREESRPRKLVLCGISYFLAMLAKEPAVFLPVIFLLLDGLFFGVKLFTYKPREEKPVEGELSKEDDFDLGIKLDTKEIKKYLVFGGVCVGYFLLRFAVLKSVIGSQQLYFGVFSLPERIYTSITLFGQYASKFFYPNPLLFFYYFEKKSAFLSPKFILSFLALIAYIAGLFLLFKKKQKLVAIFSAWMLIFLWPVLYFVYSAGENVFCERYLFVPSIGFSFLLAFFVHQLWQKRKDFRIYILVALALIGAICWAVIFPHNRIYQNDFTLYRATLALNPRAYALRRNLAVEIMDQGDLEQTKAELDKILEMNPSWWEIDKVYSQLGDYWRQKGDYGKAIELYNKAIEVSGSWNYKPYNNLGVIYMEKEEYLKALPYFCRASQLGPQAPEVINNLNRISSLFESVKSQGGLKKLNSDITTGQIFSESQEEKIRYFKRTCNTVSCEFVLLSRTASEEIILPFLILAYDSKGEMVKISEKSFDPASRSMMLSLEAKYENETIAFILPNCGNVYYKVIAPVEQKQP